MNRLNTAARSVAFRRDILIGSADMAMAMGLPIVTLAGGTSPATAKSHSHHWGKLAVTWFTPADGAEIYYKDWGRGQPVVFSHGWPLSADAWEDQMVFLAAQGSRCIAHDRRGPRPLEPGLARPRHDPQGPAQRGPARLHPGVGIRTAGRIVEPRPGTRPRVLTAT